MQFRDFAIALEGSKIPSNVDYSTFVARINQYGGIIKPYSGVFPRIIPKELYGFYKKCNPIKVEMDFFPDSMLGYSVTLYQVSELEELNASYHGSTDRFVFGTDPAGWQVFLHNGKVYNVCNGCDSNNPKKWELLSDSWQDFINYKLTDEMMRELDPEKN